MATQNSEVNSVILTIALSLSGILWAVLSYLLFTKWFCCNGEAIKDKLLHRITAKCRQRADDDSEENIPTVPAPRDTEEGQRFEATYTEVTSVGSQEEDECEGDNIDLRGSSHEMSGVVETSVRQRLSDNSHDLETQFEEESGDHDKQDVDDDSDLEEHDNEDGKPLLGSYALVTTFTVLHIIAKPIVIAVNIVFLIEGSNPLNVFFNIDILGNNNTRKNDLELAAEIFSQGITNFCIYYETGFLVFGPLMTIIIWVCCWRRHGNFRASCCRRYMEYLRFNDLELAILVAPFANIHLFFLGNVWYTVLIIRLVFYAITFATAVIAGIRFVCAISCVYCCSCACNNRAVEIRNYRHLFAGIGFQLLSIFLKLTTASSAFSTYLKLGIQGSYRFRQKYLTFTVIRGVTSMFSLGFTAALLRWVVLKKEHQEGRSCLSRILGWLDKYQPHTHVAFVIDLVSYTGLLVLNVMLLGIVQQ